MNMGFAAKKKNMLAYKAEAKSPVATHRAEIRIKKKEPLKRVSRLNRFLASVGTDP
jgi:hypothetical protein